MGQQLDLADILATTSFVNTLNVDTSAEYAGNLGGIWLGALRSLGYSIAQATYDYKPLELPKAKQVVIVLVDGLGWHNLQLRKGHVPFIKQATQKLLTTFPSTTATALTTFGTAKAPANTNMMSYSLRDPHNQVFSLISWANTELTPREWQLMPTLPTRYQNRCKMASVGQAKFIDSGITLCAFAGIAQYSAPNLAGRITRTLQLLKQHQLVYLYWGEIDKAGHRYGVNSESWIRALELLDAHMQELAARLPKDCLLLISADHGMLDIDTYYDLKENSNLARDISLVAGEGRGLHVYTKQSPTEAQVENWRQQLDNYALVLTRDELLASGLLGGNYSTRYEALGDLILLAKDAVSLTHRDYFTATAISMPGQHGSITPVEMEVPLLVYLK